MDVRDAMPVTAEGAVVYGIIYMITNTVNGKVYIGQTTRSLKERAAQHLKCKFKTPLYFAIAKYGSDKFIMATIDHAATKEELDELEKFHIREKNARDGAFGYNLQEGGSNGKHSVTSREKMSAAVTKRMASPEARAKMSEQSRKFWESPEMRAKMSAAIKKGQAAPEVRAKRSAGAKKRLESPEARAKMLAAIKKGQAAPEARAKMLAAIKKNWESPEARAKMLAAIKKGQAAPEVRAKISAATKKSLESPEARAKMSAAAKKGLAAPEVRAKISAASKKNWALPEIRAKILASTKTSLESPRVRAKMSAAAKKNWESPEMREKILKAQKMAWREKRGQYIVDSFGNLFYSVEDAAKHHRVLANSIKYMLSGKRKNPLPNGLTFSRVKPKTPPKP